MDLALYGRVLWRFRWLVLCGLLLGILLAVVSVARITPEGVVYRKHEVWRAQASLLLTQPGFPEGRALFPDPTTATSRSKFSYAEATRFASLTALYSQFAQSDEVNALVLSEGAPPGAAVSAAPLVPPGANAYTVLPVISLFGAAYTPTDAVKTTRLGTQAFIEFLERNQREAQIPQAQRVHVKVLARARQAAVLEPRKKTLPIVVFLTVLTATVSLAFVLENVRPRVRSLPEVASPGESAAVADARRSA